MKKRFTKYHTGKDKTSAQFFSIGVGKLLGPADLLLEKDLMILTISSFRYVIGDFLPLGILFAMLGPIFVKKKLKFSAIFTGLKSKTSLFFMEHGVRLLFLLTLTIQ